MKSAIIFDLDGTLIDTPSGIVETFQATLDALNIERIDASVLRATIGLTLEKAFSMLLGLDLNDDRVHFAVSKYHSLLQEIVSPKAKELIFPGVVEGLVQLKNQGFLLAIATSKIFKSAEHLLKAAELWDSFDLVLAADQVAHPKPHPEIGLLALKSLGVSADRSMMVGDTIYDLLMAKDAGMRSIGVTHGIHTAHELKSASPTWIVDSFDEVIQCIQKEFFIKSISPIMSQCDKRL